jgi:prolyl-tRNA synthetase
MSSKKLLPSRAESSSEWYTTLLRLADLADYGPAKGSMIIKPYGYALWENVQAAMNPLIKERGVENAYFPLLIPMSLLQKEADHVEGFAPELAVVTHGGGEELVEKLVIRPTSETIMYNSFAKWIGSWRDLPLMMNQWNNVVRWEKRTMPFLRSSEFLWQEGHTVHATHEEASEIQLWAMNMYAKIYTEQFAIAGYVGYKSTAERFSGADSSLTYEALMPNGKALQSCTSHDLGQNFSKAFEISFQTKEGSDAFAWQTSWGFSTRSIGGLILSHGDDNGLVLPPAIAPIQVVVIPIKEDTEQQAYAQELAKTLNEGGIRAKADISDAERFGFKMNKWEVKGVPLIIKIGQREIEDATTTVKARFTGEERAISKAEILEQVPAWLKTIQQDMLAKNQKHLADNTREARTYEEFKTILQTHGGLIKVFWNDNPEIEEKIKQETKASSRCQPLEFTESNGIDFYTGEPATKQWIFGQSY